MLLTDYFRSQKDLSWDYALQCGVTHGVIRLPETPDFDLCDRSHWQTVYDRFTGYGITPVVIEPLPNALHDHIKAGDDLRDESLDKLIRMFPIMEALDIRVLCFNFMAHIGWLRTDSAIPERGGARVTGFDLNDFKPTDRRITADELWRNYEYFVKAAVPEAEKHGIRLALHPDDPPLPRLGDVERIFVSAVNIRKALYDFIDSPSLGLTMCQANFHIMGENLDSVIRDFADKIHFIHFRNVTGTVHRFRETCHDNGEIDMAHVMREYIRHGIDVPIRVDHVPAMAGEDITHAGYDILGRLFAIGYLKGLLDASITQ